MLQTPSRKNTRKSSIGMSLDFTELFEPSKKFDKKLSQSMVLRKIEWVDSIRILILADRSERIIVFGGKNYSPPKRQSSLTSNA